jgi:restriction endonuclease
MPQQQQQVQVTHYVFQVQDMSKGGAMRMNTQADQNSAVGAKLAQLYQNVTTSMSQKNIDFLKSLVPK